jgi:hypothetical protein
VIPVRRAEANRRLDVANAKSGPLTAGRFPPSSTIETHLMARLCTGATLVGHNLGTDKINVYAELGVVAGRPRATNWDDSRQPLSCLGALKDLSETMPPRKITLIRAALPIKCPECDAAISWHHATGHVQFQCPKCGHGLHLRNNYFRVLYLFAFVVVTSVAYAAGARGDSLFAIVILGLWPTHFLLVFITMRLFPPDVESTGDFRGILYGSVVAEDASPSVGLPVSADAMSEQSTLVAGGSDQPRVFTVGKEHRTLEGVALRGAAIVLALSMVWMAARPLIYRIAPELGATKNGPAAFPVKVHIGDDEVAFTNGSTEAWSCKAELGFGEEHASIFSIGPQQTRELSYLEFRGSDTHVSLVELRDAAREKITIDCAESSGRTHFWQFR